MVLLQKLIFQGHVPIIDLNRQLPLAKLVLFRQVIIDPSLGFDEMIRVGAIQSQRVWATQATH